MAIVIRVRVIMARLKERLLEVCSYYLFQNIYSIFILAPISHLISNFALISTHIFAINQYYLCVRWGAPSKTNKVDQYF